MSDTDDYFNSILIRTDVTCLKLFDEKYLLSGLGNTVCVYENVKNFIYKFVAFVGQKVHGIERSDDRYKLAVYGGKEICFYNFNSILNKNAIVDNKIHCNDWILSVSWLKNENNLALLTAHNVVQIWNTERSEIVSTYSCNEKCILYSGIILNLSNNIIVMGGTVFSQVIVWDIKSLNVNNRLIGHKGVIFSIAYCNNKKYIVTTSDDRSVKIWKLKSKDIPTDATEYWTSDDFIDSTITLFGHTARVMKAMVNNETIVSIGEDSIMCVWDVEGKLILKRKLAKGGPLWCLDCDFKNEIAIIGGSDSSVSVCSIKQNLAKMNTRAVQFLDAKVKAKKALITARNNIVCLTECGKLFYFNFEEDKWREELTTNNQYQHLSLSLCKQFIALGTNDGRLQIFAEVCKNDAKLVHLIDQKLIEGRILSLLWICNRMLVISNQIGEITVWSSQGGSCSVLLKSSLPMCKERWLTSAAAYLKPDFILLVGDRCGNLHLYDRSSSLPFQTISKVHGRLGINSIEIVEDGLFTAGRDKTVKYFQLQSQDGSYKLRFNYSIKTPFEWVEKFLDVDRQLICGFKETDFIVWNKKYETNICAVDCGGGHRSWDVKKRWVDNTNLLTFIYVKNHLVNTFTLNMNETIIEQILESFHVNEVNCMAVFSNKNEVFLITGGEDTTISVNRLNIENKQTTTLTKHLVLSKHLSSVRCIDYSEFNYKNQTKHDKSFILFTAGGRAQICIWKVIFNESSGLDISELGNYMLQGTDQERRRNWKSKSETNSLDTETRIMSLKFISENNEKYLIAGCSDGYLRIYSVDFSLDGDSCQLFMKANVTSDKKCILKVYHFNYKQYSIVITMSVNGALAFWNLAHLVRENDSECIDFIYKTKLHKAGFNSFLFYQIDEELFALISGGDDNTICLNVFKMIDNSLKIDLIANKKLENVHSCQITGIKLIDSKRFITVSIDQRCTLFYWHYKKEENEILCDFVTQYISSVSDIQGIEIFNRDYRNCKYAAVYGKGMEIFSFEVPLETECKTF